MTNIEPLLALLRNADRNDRSAAALQLGKIGQGSAVDSLIQALFAETDLNVQEDITWALNQLKQVAVPELIAFLNNESDEIRHRATHTLGKLKSVQATNALITVLHDTSPAVRYKATVALGQIKDVRAIPALIQALDDPVMEVSQGASDALVEFDTEAVTYLVDALQVSSETIRPRSGPDGARAPASARRLS
ncbi:MAG: HEAT repeat domain-containing protein, partial [Chloroflexi bacterium]|nr:HEAT repeat domain-containing protein [Chloroflexota bacterium]